MKSPFLSILAASGGVILLVTALPSSSQGQAAKAAADDPIPALVEEVVAQHAKIVANQTSIDEKIAAIGEEVRQARLFVARGGGGVKK